MMPPTTAPLQVEYAMFVQKSTLREDLVKIAFDRRLEWGDSFPMAKDALAKEVVEFADAVLAEMEKPKAEDADNEM